MPPSVFLKAEWRKLIMAQYAVDPAILTPFLPAGLALDLFHGECFVSLIGFLFDRVRIKGLAIPFHTRFEEVNLRFYVRARDKDGSTRRGVVFVREFVPRMAITLVANLLYEEPYRTLRMRREITQTKSSLEVLYDWKARGRWYRMAAEASPALQPIAPGSIEEFITEHYWGFTKRSHGPTSQYQVEHPRWETYAIRRSMIDVDFGALYGPTFALLNAQQPASVLLAEGAPVSIRGGTRLPTID